MNYFPNPEIGNINGDANYFFPQIQNGYGNNMGMNGLYGQNMPNGYHQQYAVNGLNNFIGPNGFNGFDGLNNFNGSNNSGDFSMVKPNPTLLMTEGTNIDPILRAMCVLFIFCLISFMITEIVADLVYIYYRVNQHRHHRRIRFWLAEATTTLF